MGMEGCLNSSELSSRCRQQPEVGQQSCVCCRVSNVVPVYSRMDEKYFVWGGVTDGAVKTHLVVPNARLLLLLLSWLILCVLGYSYAADRTLRLDHKLVCLL